MAQQRLGRLRPIDCSREERKSTMRLKGLQGARRLADWASLAVLSALVLSLSAVQAPADSHFGCNTLVCASVTTTGTPGDWGGGNPDLSADGRYVVFQSESTNLEPGAAGGPIHVYRRDLATGHTVRVSVSATGAAGNGISYFPVVSGDGARVAYYSSSTNLVATDADSTYDVYAWDAASGAVTLVSVSTAGVKGDGQSYSPSISENGRYVAVESDATNLDGADANGDSDIYLRDLTGHTTERISVSMAGGDPDGASWEPKVSADGRYVMFYSDASNLVVGDTNGDYDVFVRDTVNNTTTRVSVADDETQISDGTGLAMTPDGRYILFHTWDGLAAGDTNSQADVYLRDRIAGTTELVSKSTLGVCGNDPSYDAAISGDGRYVLIQSYATNLGAGDINTHEDLYLRDRNTGITSLVSKNASRTVGNSQSVWPMISKDGRYFGFVSSATNYVEGDANGDDDVFVRDRMQSASTVMITSPSQTLAYGSKYALASTLTSGGAPVSGETLKVQQASGPAGPWTDASVEGTTSADGSFSCKLAPASATYYRVAYAGSGLSRDSAVSSAVKVTPRAWVGNPSAPSKMSRKKSYTVYGYLKPRHSAGSYPVRIYKYRKVSGKWKSQGYVKAKASNYGSYTKYSVKGKLTKKGKWRLRAFAPADSGHAESWSSGYDYVTVR
jgi:hypothetical protein